MNKRILVTGATGGIGEILCDHLASLGYVLTLAARNKQNLRRLTENLIEKYGGQHRFETLDFSSSVSVTSTANTIVSRGEQLNGMIIMPPQAPSTSESLPAGSEWQELFTRCFINPLEFLKGVLPLMENGIESRSKVVIVSGISSAQILSHYATSNVLRCAWLAQAKTLAFAYGPKGIHFNTVSLGGTMTEEYQQGIASRAAVVNQPACDQLAQETSNIPLRKYGSPEEVARVIEGFLSPFSDHLTGINLLCDGGFTRSY